MSFTAHLHRPLDHMLREAVDGLDEPALLLDADLQVTHVNQAAAPLFEGPTFTQETEGCLSPLLDGQPCTGEPLCGGCEIFRTLMVSVATGETVGPIHLQRQEFVDGALVMHSYEAEAHPFRLDGKIGLLVTLAETSEDCSGRLAG